MGVFNQQWGFGVDEWDHSGQKNSDVFLGLMGSFYGI